MSYRAAQNEGASPSSVHLSSLCIPEGCVSVKTQEPGISKVRLLPYHGGGSEVRVLGWVIPEIVWFRSCHNKEGESWPAGARQKSGT